MPRSRKQPKEKDQYNSAKNNLEKGQSAGRPKKDHLLDPITQEDDLRIIEEFQRKARDL